MISFSLAVIEYNQRKEFENYKCWAYKYSIYTYQPDFVGDTVLVKVTDISGPWEKVWAEKYLQETRKEIKQNRDSLIGEPIIFKCPCNE